MSRFAPWSALGARLRAGREATTLSQARLARRLGVNQSVISAYERGEMRPRRERLAVCAAVLGLDPQELAVLAGYARPDEAEG